MKESIDRHLKSYKSLGKMPTKLTLPANSYKEMKQHLTKTKTGDRYPDAKGMQVVSGTVADPQFTLE